MFPEEWNAVVDALDILYNYMTSIDPRHMSSDVVPSEDAKYDVGRPDRRWRAIYAMYGYFYTDLLVQGKKVIKDGDPIQIASFIDEAKQDVDAIKQNLQTIATNTGTTASNTSDIRAKLDAINDNLSVVSAKLDKTNDVLASIDSRVSSVDSKLGDVVSFLGEVSSKQDLLALYAKYIPDIYARLGSIEEKVDLALTELKSIDSNTSNISTKLDTSNAILVSMDKKLSDTLSALSEISSKEDVLALYAKYLPDIYMQLLNANTELSSIESRTASIDVKLDNVVSTLSDIDAKLANNRYLPEIYMKLDEVSTKLSAIDTRLDKTNITLAHIAVDVDNIDKKMDSAVSFLSEISSKEDLLTRYAKYLPDIYMKSDEISKKLDVANEKLDVISGDIREVSAKLDTLASIDQKVGNISSQLDVISGKLSNIETNTGLTNELLQDTNNFLSEISSKENVLLLYARYTQDIYVQLVESSRKLSSIDAKIDVDLSTRASEETLKKLTAFDYDFALRRNAGRLLATIDFTINPTVFGITETQLGLIRVEGSAKSVDIVRWSDEGIAQPEGTGSPYIMKIVVGAGGTVYVRVPVKARYWHAFSAYVSLYAKDYDIYALPYVVLGGILAGSRNRLPKLPRLPANRWGRFMIHWFMEAHHGCAEVVVEIYNPNNVDVVVYLGVVTAGEIEFNMKGFGMLFGWEDTFELELSNESLSFDIHVMIPTDIESVAHMMVSIGIAGDGSNPMNASITLHPGGVTLISASNANTTPAIYDKRFKAWLNRRGVYDFQTMVFNVNLSTNGTGKVTRFVIVFFAITEEYRYSKAVSGTVAPNTTSTVIDLNNDVKHICGGELVVTAPSDGSVDVLADTPEGTIPIYIVPAGTTRTVRIEGRYTVLQLRNNSSSSSASYTGYVVISDAMLFR